MSFNARFKPHRGLVILHRPYPLSCQLYFEYLAVFHLSVLLDNDWICGTWRPNMKPSEIFEVDPKRMKCAINLYNNSLNFWPTYHRRSTDIPLTINGQHIGRVSAAISTEISVDSRPIQCWFCQFFECTDYSTFTTLNWGVGGTRELMLDANKIEQLLKYWKASFPKSVSTTFVAHCLEAIYANCGNFLYISML